MKRYWIAAHRWLGGALWLPFILWFASGMVMAFVDDMPYLDAQPEFWSRLPALDFSRARIGPAQAALDSGLKGPPDSVLCVMDQGRPAYLFRAGDKTGVVYADGGGRLAPLDVTQAQERAAAWFQVAPKSLVAEGALDVDQWTVGGGYRPYGPLWKFEASDPAGTWIYVSSATGQVVQAVTARQRFWGTLGPVIHWVYWTPLRSRAHLWRVSVTILSGIGILVAASGLVTGLWQLRRRKGRMPASPYGNVWLRWHHLLGLTGGLLACTWIFSGFLSMSPFHWPWPDDLDVTPLTLSGGPLDLKRVVEPMPGAVARLGQGIAPRRAEIIQVAGRPFLLGREDSKHSRIAPLDSLGPAFEQFGPGYLAAPFAGQILRQTILTRYDAYYYSKRGGLRLPALRLDLASPPGALLYLSLTEGKVGAYYTFWTKVNRWLYSGLHRWDYPALLADMKVWYAVVLSGLALGLLLALTGAKLALGWYARGGAQTKEVRPLRIRKKRR